MAGAVTNSNPRFFHAHNLNIKQLQQESDSWKRLLAFILDENIHLKNRLSETIKNNVSKGMLSDLETFHNSFINKDELVGMIRKDISEFDKLLEREQFEDGNIFIKVKTCLKELRRSVETTESKFGKLKSDFNNYLSENM